MTQVLIRHGSAERGYILISTIVMVLLITLLALAGVSFNSTQTRIATNSRDSQIAFEAAEATLREVSDYIGIGQVPNTPSCGNLGDPAIAGVINAVCAGPGISVATADETPLWLSANAPWTTTLPNGGNTYQGNSFQPAAYIVEGLLPQTFLNDQSTQLRPFRITVQAWGGIAGTPPQVMLQTIVLGPP